MNQQTVYPLTPQQLLIPRYEVIAPWPDMSPLVKVGHIFTPIKKGSNYYQSEQNAALISLPNECPANLRPLPWYHGRKIEEMPEYVKVVSKEISFIYGTIIKANRWGVYPDEGYGFGNEGDFYAGITQPIKTNTRDAGEEITINVCHLSPALESDYITFKNREK